MSMNKFTCIKPACSNSYETEETDAYYCPSCLKEKDEIAKKIDAQIATRPKKPRTSMLQEYEAQIKSSNMKAGGVPGVHIKI